MDEDNSENLDENTINTDIFNDFEISDVDEYINVNLRYYISDALKNSHYYGTLLTKHIGFIKI